MDDVNSLSAFIEEHYPIQVKEAQQLTDKTFKLITDSKPYLLKFAVGDDEFIMKQLFAHKTLPHSVLPIYRTKTHDHRVALGQQFAYLTDYIAVIPVPLEKQVNYYTELLKKLHRETELTVDMSEDEITRLHDREYKQLQTCYGLLQRNMEAFELKLDRSPYEWYYMMLYPTLYSLLHHANDELKNFYELLKKEKQAPMCLIHGDVNVANVLVSEKANYLINFERSNFGMAGDDMASFLKAYHQVPGVPATLLDYVKNEKSALLRHYFFYRSLCVDLQLLDEAFKNHALINIGMLNEIIAPHILAMEIHQEFHKKPAEAPKNQAFQDLLNAAKKA